MDVVKLHTFMKIYLKEYFRLLKFVKPYIGTLVLASLCMGVSTIFNGVSFTMIIPLCDRVLTNKEIILPVALPGFLTSFVNKLNHLDPMVILKSIAIFMISLFFFKEIFLFLQNYLMNIVGQSVVREVKDKLYTKFNRLSLDFYSTKRTGELISRITNDVALITQAISYGLGDFIYNAMQILVYAVITVFLAFSISWKLSLVVFVIFPLVIFPVVRIGKKIKKLSIEVQRKMADLNSVLAETIPGAYIVKVFCREDYEINRFKKINLQHYKFIMKGIKRTLLLSPLTEFVSVLGSVVVLIIVGQKVISGELSFGLFGMFLAFLMSMMRPIKKLTNVHAINQQAFAASDRIYDILEEKVSITEKSGAVDIKNFKEKICFSGVWFRYGQDDVLKDINLEVKKREVIAIVGHSGAGKSTLVSLLPRLYDPQKGSVLIDGVDLRDMKLKSLRTLSAVVSQEMVLFNVSVHKNIGYGMEDATDSQIEVAAKRAYALDFINKLPQGFATVIGDRGFKLSGGERQRISIARAILKDAPILILDEATSHLDSESEQLVKEAFYSLMKEKTVFVIAHRLSTVQRADRIVVLDSGRIVEVGTHSALLVGNTVYKKLYEMQFKA